MIIINNDWAISSDPLSVMLHKSNIAHKGRYKGEKVWRTIGWYNNYSHALQALIDRDVQEQDYDDLKDIVRRIEELKEDIVKVYGQASPIRDVYSRPPARKGII